MGSVTEITAHSLGGSIIQEKAQLVHTLRIEIGVRFTCAEETAVKIIIVK
jgi:hypothetical protein